MAVAMMDLPLLLEERGLARQSSLGSARSYQSAVSGARSAASMRFSERSAATGMSVRCPHCIERGTNICAACSGRKASISSSRYSVAPSVAPSVSPSAAPSKKSTSKWSVVKKSLPEVGPVAAEMLRCLRESKVDLHEIKALLQENKAAANAVDVSFGWSPVLCAAHRGNSKLLCLLLDYSGNINFKCNQGNSALHIAARNGNMNVATILQSRGADINVQNLHGWTPLMWSAIAGCPSIASALLDVSADANIRDTGGRTACMWAARHGHTDILRTLLGMGADLSSRDEDGMSIKDHARYFSNMQQCIASRAQAEEESEALYWATASGDLDLQRLLMQHGAGQSLVDMDAPIQAVSEAIIRSDELLTAARKGDWEAAEEALRAGACVSTRGDPDLCSPLIWAAIHDAPASAFALVAAMADVEARDHLGWTALHHAVHAESAQTVAVLHYMGADFSVKSDSGDSVQHIAALSDSGEILQLLGPATPDWNIRDAAGHTPLQVAVTRGCLAAVSALLSLEADASVTDEKGLSLLALAAAKGHVDVARTLLEPIEPLPIIWGEDELKNMVDKLPWVDSDVVDSDEPVRRGSCSSSSSSVCSGSQAGSICSSASGRNDKLGTKLAAKLLQRKQFDETGMHTIPEASESEAGSAVPSARGERPQSAGSHVSRKSIALTHVSSQSHAASVAKSAASVAKSSTSHISAAPSLARSSQSQVSLRSKPGSIGMDSKHSMAGSRTSNKTGRSLGGKSKGSAGGRSRVGSIVSNNMPKTIYSMALDVIGRSPVSLMNAADILARHGASASTELPAPLVPSVALAATAEDGSTPLCLATRARQFDMVRLLLELKASPDTADSLGNTALMIAASVGDKNIVLTLLDAQASVDEHNSSNMQAVDLACRGEISEILQAAMKRRAVAEKMSKSCSLPALVKEPARRVKKQKMSQVRLDCMPTNTPADQIEAAVRGWLKRYHVASPLTLTVEVDPISLLSRGHVLLDYGSLHEASAAAELLDDHVDDVRVSVDGEPV